MKSKAYRGFRSKNAVHNADLRRIALEARRDKLRAGPKTLDTFVEYEEVQKKIAEEIAFMERHRIIQPKAITQEKEEVKDEPQYSEEEMATQLDDLLRFLESRPERGWRGGEIAKELQAMGVKWTLEGSTKNHTISKTIASRLGQERKSPNSRITARHMGEGKGFIYHWRPQVQQQAVVEVKERRSPVESNQPVPAPVFPPVEDQTLKRLEAVFKDLETAAVAVFKNATNIYQNASLVVESSRKTQQRLEDLLAQEDKDRIVVLEELDIIKKQVQMPTGIESGPALTSITQSLAGLIDLVRVMARNQVAVKDKVLSMEKTLKALVGEGGE